MMQQRYAGLSSRLREVDMEKIRVNVTLSAEIVKRIDDYCALSGMTRSGYIANVVTQSILTTDQIVTQMTKGLADVVKGESDK